MTDSAKIINKIVGILDTDLCLTIDDLAEMTELSNRIISKAATQLIYRGLVERVEKGCYQLTQDGIVHKSTGKPLTSGPFKPRTGVAKIVKQTFRTRLWRAMRRLEKFTIDDLLQIATDGTEKDPRNNAQRYVKALLGAEYLIGMRQNAPSPRRTSNGFKRYMLVRNSGHLPPVFRKAANQNEIHDRNLQEVFPCRA